MLTGVQKLQVDGWTLLPRVCCQGLIFLNENMNSFSLAIFDIHAGIFILFLCLCVYIGG